MNEKKLPKLSWTFEKWTKKMSKIHLPKKVWPRNLKKKRVRYEMKEKLENKVEKGPHKHLFLGWPALSAFFGVTFA